MSNYATKADLRNATGADTSGFAKETDLANLKSNADKLDIVKLKILPTNLSNLKNKVNKLDVDKLVDLSKLSDVVKNDVVKKDVYTKIKHIEDKIPDILATNATFNTKINELKNKIPNIINLAAITVCTVVENRMLDNSKHITTQERNKLTAEDAAARLAQANSASKNDTANFVK